MARPPEIQSHALLQGWLGVRGAGEGSYSICVPTQQRGCGDTQQRGPHPTEGVWGHPTEEVRGPHPTEGVGTPLAASPYTGRSASVGGKRFRQLFLCHLIRSFPLTATSQQIKARLLK